MIEISDIEGSGTVKGIRIPARVSYEKNRCTACGYQLPIVGSLSKSAREDRFASVIDY